MGDGQAARADSQVGVLLRHGRGQRDDAGAEQRRHDHRVLDAELADQEADHGRAEQERRVAEGDHDGQHPAAAEVAGDRVHLRGDHADAETDQGPADHQQRQAARPG